MLGTGYALMRKRISLLPRLALMTNFSQKKARNSILGRTLFEESQWSSARWLTGSVNRTQYLEFSNVALEVCFLAFLLRPVPFSLAWPRHKTFILG